MTARDRPARVAHELLRALSGLIGRGLKDPRVTGLVTVTDAKVSPDLREAVAWVSIHGEEKVREQTLAGLQAAAGWLQREAARSLGLRHTPHLRFEYDASVEHGDRIERLLREVKEKEGWK